MTAVPAADALAAAIDDLDRQRPGWHVPALEVAVVAPDHPDVATALNRRGAGDDSGAVGSGTLFHHGSCVKAYTALTATLLADEGRLDLDAPVRRLVPEFRLPDAVLAERITLRDLLSHRSGMGRHDLAWVLRPDLDEEGLLAAIAALPPAGDLRAGFGYSNFGYALAGLAMGRAAGTSWADEVRARVLEPAGLKQTTISPFPGPGDADDRATPHVLRAGRPEPTAWRSLRAIGPAGQLVTCAEDAAAWLHLQLGNGPAAIPTSAVTATHAAAVTLPPDVNRHEPLRWTGYALGWVTGTFRGRPLLWHSGGIDGFLTNTLLLPEDGIGITVCANLHFSDLPWAAVHQLADALLGTDAGTEPSWYERARADASPAEPRPERRDAPPSQPLAECAGRYVDDCYGELVVDVDGDALAIRLGTADLGVEHRHYDTWDAHYEPLDERVPFTFVRDAGGAVAEVVAPLDGVPTRFRRA